MTWTEELAGVWLPLPLPIAEDGEVDLDAWGTALEAYGEADLAGWCAGASTGEVGELADLEHAEWTGLVATLGPGAALHVGHPEPGEVLARAHTAASLDPAALLVPGAAVEPDELPAFAAALGREARGAPLVLVEPPGATLFTPALVEGLRDVVPALAGLALSARGEEGYEPLRRYEEELALWVPDAELATGYRRGACGSVSLHALLCPTGTAEWFDALEHDTAGAVAFERTWQRFLEDRLHPLAGQHGASAAALDKVLAVAGGRWPGSTSMRWPNAAVPDDAARDLGEHAARAGVLWA